MLAHTKSSRGGVPCPKVLALLLIMGAGGLVWAMSKKAYFIGAKDNLDIWPKKVLRGNGSGAYRPSDPSNRYWTIIAHLSLPLSNG